MQGWEFALSLKIAHVIERLWAIRYCGSLKKSNPEQMALIALNKRATVSNLLGSLMTEEQLWAYRSCCSVKKSDLSDSLMIRANLSQKPAIPSKKFIFFICFWQFFTAFPLFYAQGQIAPVALHSVALF